MSGWIKAASFILMVVGMMAGSASSSLAADAGFTPDAARGAKIFDTICSHCHLISYEESKVGAPGLKGVLDRHDVKWLNQWIKSPEAFAKTDEAAKALIAANKYGIKMPTFPQMQDDHNRADIIAYLKTLKGDE